MKQRRAATPMSKGIGLTVVATAVAWMTLGPSPQPAATAAVIEARTYPVTPASVTVKTGGIAGDVTDMKVTERVEQGSGTSANQIDAQGQPIQLEEARTEPTVRFAMYGSERLDPGQDATQSLDVEFPAEALKAKRSPYRTGMVNFTVSIGQASKPGRWSPVGTPPIQAESFSGA